MGFRQRLTGRLAVTRPHQSIGLFAALAAVGLVACSSGGGGDGARGPDGAGTGGDDGLTTAGSGAGGNSTAGGGGNGQGGSGTSGSGAGSGGSGSGDGGTPEGDAGTCQFMGTPIDPSSLPSCESDTCQDAHCLPRSVVTPEQSELLADCDEDNECVPDLLIRTLGLVLLQTCESLGGAEGRCISTCVPQVETQIDALPQDVCDDGERCAPCYDPITGDDTGACSQGCDEGPTEDPYAFEECCGGVSVCVPEALVPDEQRGMLGAEGCADDGELCAPKAMASDRSFVPESCESLGGAEGRCLPSCLPDVARQADRLPRDSCESGELCAPCFDPISGDETGACGIAGDEPDDDPFVFAECCGGEASCVPESLVPEDQRDLLDADTCTGTDVLCAPKDIAAGSYEPDTCVSWGGAEGRCLLACLPDVAARASQLSQADCGDEELCVPCYDPLTGEDTSACTLEGDEPEEPAYEFPTCCDDGEGVDLGTCVPTALVPEEQRAMLSAETCSGSGFLCAPTTLATGSYEPVSCTSLAGAEGRCMPACLPDVAAQAAVLPADVCSQGSLCAPCYDPITGLSTGSCELEGDQPEDAPVLFPGCCDDGDGNDLGACVPIALVPVDQQSMLSAETCVGSGVLCAPKDIAAGDYEPETCQSWDDAEGRCLPACLPDVAAQASQLTQDLCDQGKLCVPCYDPLTGESTGSCELEGDEPEDDAYTFPLCCDDGAGGELGTCVPTALVPGDQVALLAQDSCDSGALCAPTPIAHGSYVPESCDSWGGGEGRCLPACLPDIEAQSHRLTRGTCGQGELCAPCYDPLSGEDTGSCRLEGDAPVESPAYLFPTCCDDGTGNDLGTCVPDALVPEAQLSLLDADTCTGDGFLCAPTDVANDAYTPIDCNSWLGAEGRCLPACLPDVEAQAGSLQAPASDACAQGKLCVPCYTQVDGSSTGACTLEPDAPTEAARIFPRCCPTNSVNRGTCVPARAAGAQAASLPNLNCETLTNDADDYVCAPTEKVLDQDYVFPTACTTNCGADGFTCGLVAVFAPTTFGNAGRCMASCFLREQATPIGDNAENLFGPGADTAQHNPCPTGEDCAPCVDPQTGNPTGVCP